jgi:hypothetical protein
MSDMQDKITTMTTPLVFFSLEFNRIADDRYDALMAENEGSGALQARARPDARDEAAPAVGRAGTLPARHLRRRRERVEQAVR